MKNSSDLLQREAGGFGRSFPITVRSPRRSVQVVSTPSNGKESLFQPHYERRVYVDPTIMTTDDITTLVETNQLLAKLIESNEMIMREATHGLPWTIQPSVNNK